MESVQCVDLEGEDTWIEGVEESGSKWACVLPDATFEDFRDRAGLRFWRVCQQLLGTQAEVNLESCGPQHGKKQDFLSQVAIDTWILGPLELRGRNLSRFSAREL